MNINNINLVKFYLLSFVSIVLISFLVLHPSFKLAFQDEDWRGVVLPKTDYANSKLSTYSAPLWFMDALYTRLGPNFSAYYILAFIFRTLVVFSMLILIYNITKDRLAAFLGTLFLAVSFTGIQNTYEVMNMIAYISMAGLIIFLTALFKTLDKFSFIYLATMGISLLFATFLVSARVYPVYAWAFIFDSSRLLISFKKEIFKSFLIRQLVILTVFLFLYKIGIFSWYSKDASAENKISDFSRFVSDIMSAVASLNSNIANFLKGLGNIIFPDILDKSGTISLFLGLFYLIILTGLFFYVIKRRTASTHLLFAFLVWPLLFYTSYFVIYINSSPASPIIGSYMRYLFPPFLGFCIALAILVSLGKKSKLGGVLLGSIIVLILIHAISTYFFLSKLSKQRDGRYMVKIWTQIKQLVPESSLSPQKLNIFYFETDGSKRAIYTVNDGFIWHATALYKIDYKSALFDSKEIASFNKLFAPPVLSFQDLISFIKVSLSDNPESDIWNRIFALRVERDVVLDIKKDVKKRIEEVSNK